MFYSGITPGKKNQFCSSQSPDIIILKVTQSSFADISLNLHLVSWLVYFGLCG